MAAAALPRPRRPGRAKRQIRRALGWIGFYILLAIIVLYTVFPFYWAIVSSLRAGSSLFSTDLIPTSPAWSNYVAVFTEQPFGRNILNSVFVAVWGLSGRISGGRTLCGKVCSTTFTPNANSPPSGLALVKARFMRY